MNDRKSDDVSNVSEKLHNDSEYLREQIKKMDVFLESNDDKSSTEAVMALRTKVSNLLKMIEEHPDF